MTAIATEILKRLDQGERRFLMRNVTWAEYEILARICEEKGTRITYDRGSVELMSPMIEHERFKYLMGRMVDVMTEELDIPLVGAGSTTYKSEILERGLEADACYYIASASRLRKVRKLDLIIDPVPDLAIEVEITSPLIDKLSIYAALGIPEVWTHDGEAIRVMILGDDGAFAPSETSLSFPFLPMTELSRFLFEYDATNDTRWARGFRAWVRDAIAPLYAARGGDADDA